MTEPGRAQVHARARGFATVDAYVDELEDVLEAIVHGDRERHDDDGAALTYAFVLAYELVDSWEATNPMPSDPPPGFAIPENERE